MALSPMATASEMLIVARWDFNDYHNANDEVGDDTRPSGLKHTVIQNRRDFPVASPLPCRYTTLFCRLSHTCLKMVL